MVVRCAGLSRRRLIWMSLCVAGPSALAQTSSKPIRVGLLLSGSQEQWSTFEQSLVDGLRERGYTEGRNLTLVRRYGNLQGTQIRGAAAELAALHVDAIVTSCTGTTRAVASAASRTPVVMASISDPVAAGLVDSLARPGGHITGRSSMSLELVPKRLELLRALLPDSERDGARIAVLMDSRNPGHELQWRSAEQAAAVLHLTLVRVDVGSSGGFGAALEGLAQVRAKGLLVMADEPSMVEHRSRIAAEAVRQKLPLVSGPGVFAEAGGLVTYGMDMSDEFRLSAAHVVKVANGVSPATLPIEQPTLLRLTINLKTAAALGITIPREILLRADAMIE